MRSHAAPSSLRPLGQCARAMHTTRPAYAKASSSASASASAPVSASSSSRALPRPVPLYPSLTLLADGSSISLQTTSPRSATRLTRDITNHPLWNPGMERRSGAQGEDESGRLGRFRRRFGQPGEERAAAPAAAPGEGPGSAQGAKGQEQQAAAADEGEVTFAEADLEWMSVGGREARAGSVSEPKKAAKGKGKKK